MCAGVRGRLYLPYRTLILFIDVCFLSYDCPSGTSTGLDVSPTCTFIWSALELDERQEIRTMNAENCFMIKCKVQLFASRTLRSGLSPAPVSRSPQAFQVVVL